MIRKMRIKLYRQQIDELERSWNLSDIF